MQKNKYSQGRYKPRNPSKYNGDPTNICYRSSLELKFMRYCDQNEKIISWCSEEFSIPYLDSTSNKIRRYYPDFLIEVRVEDKVKKYLIEVKPKAQTKKPTQGRKKAKTILYETLQYNKNISKWKYATEWCKKHGIEFKIITEDDLRP
jgi:hypothetical protein